MSIVFSIITFSFISCTPQPNGGKNETYNKPNTDIEELKKYIDIPINLVSAKWEVIQYGTGELGPSDFAIIAELEINKMDYKKLNEQSNLNNEISLKDSLLRNWISDDIRNLFSTVNQKNNKLKSNIKAKEPKKTFVKENGTLREGFFILNQNRVFLYLTTY